MEGWQAVLIFGLIAFCAFCLIASITILVATLIDIVREKWFQ